jgi:ketosteroid isomerase-like protein
MKSWLPVLLFAVLSGALPADSADVPMLEQELQAVETAFAQTMADRDHDAFAGFLSDEVIFFNGESRLVGRAAVAAAWAPYFEGEKARFSWEPDAVAVLESGTLGLTSGPVYDPAGRRIGTFNSVWRRNGDGTWRIVFDRGCPECESTAAGAASGN